MSSERFRVSQYFRPGSPSAKPFCVVSARTSKEYFLHQKEVCLSSGHRQKIFYFASRIESNAVAELPSGYKVVESNNSGLPMLKKK